jgi:hypothetical protein
VDGTGSGSCLMALSWRSWIFFYQRVIAYSLLVV